MFTHYYHYPFFIYKDLGKAFLRCSKHNVHDFTHYHYPFIACKDLGKAFLRCSRHRVHVFTHYHYPFFIYKDLGKAFLRCSKHNIHVFTHYHYPFIACKDLGKAFLRCSKHSVHVLHIITTRSSLVKTCVKHSWGVQNIEYTFYRITIRSSLVKTWVQRSANVSRNMQLILQVSITIKKRQPVKVWTTSAAHKTKNVMRYNRSVSLLLESNCMVQETNGKRHSY